jgi:hypothetical protein
VVLRICSVILYVKGTLIIMANNTNSTEITPFWLHIKKSAGSSIRRIFFPNEVNNNRGAKPVNFIQSSPDQYNAIINNFRMPLGEYQFRRALFAKTYLYPDDWDSKISFAFVREPVSRCVSAFLYLRKQVGIERSFIQERDAQNLPIDQQFDLFLRLIASAQNSASIYQPINLHFTTHTAQMWDDVTDDDGNVLLSHLFRLEDLQIGIETIYRRCHIDREITDIPHANKRSDQVDYTPTPAQIALIKRLYANDFDLYETTQSYA